MLVFLSDIFENERLTHHNQFNNKMILVRRLQSMIFYNIQKETSSFKMILDKLSIGAQLTVYQIGNK